MGEAPGGLDAANNSLNVYNASTQKTAGDIANLNVLNFDGISNANGSAATAALNLTTAGNTDINNAKFQLNGIDYDPSNDSYGSLKSTPSALRAAWR